jgi:hypothetical protein
MYVFFVFHIVADQKRALETTHSVSVFGQISFVHIVAPDHDHDASKADSFSKLRNNLCLRWTTLLHDACIYLKASGRLIPSRHGVDVANKVMLVTSVTSVTGLRIKTTTRARVRD